jgi:RNA polymerase sigma-70 factor (ECF subfamily)
LEAKKADTYQLSLKDYKTLFDELYKSLCLFSNKYIGDLDVSKDIVQDIFIKVWEDKIEFQSECKIKSYLYTSVKNKSLDYLKSKRYKSTEYNISLAQIEEMDTDAFFLREVVIVETRLIIENAIGALPKKCSKIIRLSIRNFTNLEIAKELGISINTVKAQKRIAYKRMKPLLKEHFVLIAFIFSQH